MKLHPANDLTFSVKLKEIDAEGRSVPMTTGTVTAFLATSNSPTATAADPTLSVAATHLGLGKWLISFDAAALSAALLDSLFAAATPYLIIVASGAVRAYVELEYEASREATVPHA